METLEKRALMAVVVGGSASIILHEGVAASIGEFDAYFSASKTRAQILSEPAPGDEAFIETATEVTLADPIRPFGVAPVNGDGRARQATTLQIEDLGSVLGSWTTSNDAFGFVGNSTVGEQIAFTSMQRWTGPFTGSLVYGDFALRYTGSKLVLASNIDFLNAAYADIGNPVITVSGNTLSIQGDLLIGGGLSLLDPSAIPGTDFGDINISATLAEVPIVTDPRITISGGTGTGGGFKIGDTVTAKWNNSSTGDNNTGVRAVSNVTVDFSQFGGGTAVVATNSSNIWTATYTVTSGSIDTTGRNVSVTASNAAGSSTTADSTNARVDNISPLSASINRTDANPTNAATVHYSVNFSEGVGGVNATDFALASTGVVGASIVSVDPIGSETLLANTTANGTAFMTYDRAAWATLAPNAEYTDISANPLGIFADTADATGFRWMFPDRFEGANWVNAAYPSDYLTGVTSPLVQPGAGLALAVNSYGVNSFAANHKITNYNSTTNPNGFIGLAGSLRVTSDFNEPGASVWWQKLAIQKDPIDNIWKLVSTSGAGQGSVFELRNVTTRTVNGNLYLSGDYVFGNTDWLQFLQDVNGHIDTEKILGHIEIIPAGVTNYTVSVSTGTGNGTIELDLVDDDSIVDRIGNVLGGTGVGNGNATGQVYTIVKNTVPVALPSSVNVNEDEPRSFEATDFLFSDAEGDTLSSILVSDLNLAIGDSLTVDLGSGPVAVTNGMTITAAQIPSLQFTPAQDAFGSARSLFDFTVNDSGNGTESAPMTINVTSVNDAPSLSQASYSFTVNSKALAGSTVGTTPATDIDAGSTLTYSIVGGNLLGAFGIDAATGKITVVNASKLPKIVAPATSVTAPPLTVQVSDGSLVDTATVSVILNLAPQAMSPIAAARVTTFRISENNAVAASVASLAANPAYTGQVFANWAVSDTLGGPASSMFFVKSSTATGAVIGVNSRLSFENQGSYTFFVTVSDSLDSTKVATTPITLNINDLNDAPQLSLTDGVAGAPTSTSGTPTSLVARYTINEFTTVTAGNTPKNGDVLFTLNANDDDQLSNTLSYALTGVGVTSPSAGVFVDRSGALKYDSATGQVSVADATKLDYEKFRTGIPLAFSVIDNGLPGSLPGAIARPLTSRASVVVLINDLNEAPSFAVSASNVVKAENNLANALVSKVTANDGDSLDGVASPLNYSLVSVLDGSGADVTSLFSINPTTGEIKVIAAKQYNFESIANKSFTITVRATEVGSGLTTAQSVLGDQVISLNITDINEAPAAVFTPVFGVPSVGTTGSLTVNVPDVSVGSTVGSLSITDPDILAALGTYGSDSLVVTVLDSSSTTAKAFSYVANADPTTGGELKVDNMATLQSKVGKPFTVKFTVKDKSGLAGALSFTLTLTINVTNNIPS